MIRESLYFKYNGINSMDFGIMNVSISPGMYSEPFMANRTIREFTVRGNERPYFSEVVREPLSFSLTFLFENTWDDNLISQVKQWLNVDYYKPLIFSEDPQKIYYAIPVDSLDITHNGLKQGYVTLNIRCDSPYSYSHEIMTHWYDFSSSSTNNLMLENSGDCSISPQIYIQKVGDGDLKINNFTDGNSSMEITNLSDGEELHIHCEKEFIETSIPNTYRYDDFNDTYMKLNYGQNQIQVVGKCKIKFQYQYKFL